MRPAVLLLALAAALPALAQTTASELFRKAPPAVDQALRDRVTLYYQLHMEKKWRKVAELVDEESQDAFIAQIKQNPLSFHINEVQYSDNYSRAKVMTLVEAEKLIPMGGITRMKLPIQTEWRIVDGLWMNTIPKIPCRSNPMGACNPDDAAKRGADSPDLKNQVETAMRQAQSGQLTGGGTLGFAESQVNIDPAKLAQAEQKAEFTFNNTLDGWLTLVITAPQGTPARFTIANEKVPPQSQTKVIVTLPKGYSPSGNTLSFRVAANPTNRVYDLRVYTGK